MKFSLYMRHNLTGVWLMLYILQRYNVAVKAPPSGATAMSMKKLLLQSASLVCRSRSSVNRWIMKPEKKPSGRNTLYYIYKMNNNKLISQFHSHFHSLLVRFGFKTLRLQQLNVMEASMFQIYSLWWKVHSENSMISKKQTKQQ